MESTAIYAIIVDLINHPVMSSKATANQGKINTAPI